MSDILVPDKLKTGVIHPCKYDPDINPTYPRLAEHYSTAVIPENRKIENPKVNPLPIQEIDSFLECVVLFYRPFFVVAFFTRMRAGEMSALKWKNVDFDRKIIKVVETRVYGEEGRPKTNSSYRDIDMLPMVYDALKEQGLRTRLRSRYVFLNQDNKPIDIETLRNNAWTKGLKKAGMDYRPIIQTRHTFATMVVSSGENLG